jgi:3-deoxy-manno-octulosonate cytidylyltransferase (CMP-KDO synthetase)
MNTKNFAVVIPARFQSSRFPGKPLIDLCGKPMLQHVWERCCEAVGTDKVYVATDNDQIETVVQNFGGAVIRTSSDCLTGTDRLAEANQTLNCDFIINVQGDEPLICPNDIKTVVDAFLEGDGSVVNAMCEITDEREFNSTTVPKVVCDQSGKLLYMSRAGIPLTKEGDFRYAHKQVCIYAFSKEHLNFFLSQQKKTPLESVEDIEILRFLESNYQVQMIKVDSGSMAIDVPEDVERVIKALQNIK